LFNIIIRWRTNLLRKGVKMYEYNDTQHGTMTDKFRQLLMSHNIEHYNDFSLTFQV